MATQHRISGVVISYNRPDLIRTCLKSLWFVDELLVVDKSSTDATPQIASSIADKVITVPWSPVVEHTREFAVSQCTYDWVVCIDDDECLSVQAGKFIQREVRQPRAKVYLVPQRHYILGQHDERAYYWPETQPRFFRKESVSFNNTVHGSLKFAEADVYRIPHTSGEGICIHHLSHANVEQWIEKANRYTSNPDRIRFGKATHDLATYAHQQIDYYLNSSDAESPDQTGYTTSVALLRGVYDIIDRIKTWEEDRGIDGATLFQTRCAELESEYDAQIKEAFEDGREVLTLEDIWLRSGPICGAPEGEFSKPPSYLQFYQEEFSDLRNLPLTIVEIGVFRGQFLETLGQYFPNANIIGIDFQPERAKCQSPNITLLKGDQGDADGLERIFKAHSPGGIDIIIDDASHVGELTKTCYDVGMRWLKPSGSYYIEDWGTGYWPDWPDGAPMTPPRFEGLTSDGFASRYISHDAGMIGVIKQLIDHIGAPERIGAIPLLSMHVVPGIVKLVKSGHVS